MLGGRDDCRVPSMSFVQPLTPERRLDSRSHRVGVGHLDDGRLDRVCPVPHGIRRRVQHKGGLLRWGVFLGLVVQPLEDLLLTCISTHLVQREVN